MRGWSQRSRSKSWLRTRRAPKEDGHSAADRPLAIVSFDRCVVLMARGRSAEAARRQKEAGGYLEAVRKREGEAPAEPRSCEDSWLGGSLALPTMGFSDS